MKGNRVALGRLYLPLQDIGSLSGTMRLMAKWTCLRKGHDAYKMMGFDVCRRCWKITGHPESKGKMNRSPDMPTRGNDVYTQILKRVGGVGRLRHEEDEEIELQFKEGWQ